MPLRNISHIIQMLTFTQIHNYTFIGVSSRCGPHYSVALFLFAEIAYNDF